MSKFLGNGVDPLDVIDSHGADALRFSMMMTTAQGQDVFITYPRNGEKSDGYNTFDIGRNFANKIWNATRFLLSGIGDGIDTVENPQVELADRWIVSRFNRMVGLVTESLESFRFNDASRALYDFIWHDFCDWYLEIIKPRIIGGGNDRAYVQNNAASILAGSMQLLHPIMPYITEEIWQRLTDVIGVKKSESIMTSPWPVSDKAVVDEACEEEMEKVKSLISTVRTIRNEMNVPLGVKADVVVVPADDENSRIFAENEPYILDLASVKNLTLNSTAKRPPKSAAGISGQNELFVLLEGVVDFDRERNRLEKEIDRRKKFIAGIENKLHNEDFLSKAPGEVIQHERLKLNNSREELKKLTANLEALGMK
ncbi:Valine--tRNA ligase [subsurface metagenome]